MNNSSQIYFFNVKNYIMAKELNNTFHSDIVKSRNYIPKYSKEFMNNNHDCNNNNNSNLCNNLSLNIEGQQNESFNFNINSNIFFGVYNQINQQQKNDSNNNNQNFINENENKNSNNSNLQNSPTNPNKVNNIIIKNELNFNSKPFIPNNYIRKKKEKERGAFNFTGDYYENNV